MTVRQLAERGSERTTHRLRVDHSWIDDRPVGHIAQSADHRQRSRQYQGNPLEQPALLCH
jgi:hypothetical protein